MKHSFWALVVAVVCMATVGTAGAATIYDSIPSPQPYNVPSQPYQAQQTAEFGDHIAFSGTARQLTTVTVAMSDWARRSDYMDEVAGVWTTKADFGHVAMTESGFSHPLTFNIYAVDKSGSVPATGSLVASLTSNAFIAWRPENNPTDNSVWIAPDGNPYHGYFTTVTFDFTSLNVTLPDEIIYGLAFNTYSWGSNPIGKHGPYESLNFALSTATTVGVDVDTDAVFWNTSTAAWYADKGASGVGVFRYDDQWTPYVPAVTFDAQPVPEPMTMVFFGTGLAGVMGFVARRKMRNAA